MKFSRAALRSWLATHPCHMPVLPQPALLGRHFIHPHRVPVRPPPALLVKHATHHNMCLHCLAIARMACHQPTCAHRLPRACWRGPSSCAAGTTSFFPHRMRRSWSHWRRTAFGLSAWAWSCGASRGGRPPCSSGPQRRAWTAQGEAPRLSLWFLQIVDRVFINSALPQTSPCLSQLPAGCCVCVNITVPCPLYTMGSPTHLVSSSDLLLLDTALHRQSHLSHPSVTQHSCSPASLPAPSTSQDHSAAHALRPPLIAPTNETPLCAAAAPTPPAACSLRASPPAAPRGRRWSRTTCASSTAWPCCSQGGASACRTWSSRACAACCAAWRRSRRARAAASAPTPRSGSGPCCSACSSRASLSGACMTGAQRGGGSRSGGGGGWWLVAAGSGSCGGSCVLWV